MALPKPMFNDVLSHYPISSSAFGDGGRIVNNPAYEDTCALRLSTALEGAQAGVLREYPGNRAVHHTPGHGLWAPAAGIVEYAWFWDLRRGGAWSPPSTPHSLQSG
jgi:hypothetical protein